MHYLVLALSVVTALIKIWIPLSTLVNFVIDRMLGVPADSAPGFPAFVSKHPRWAGAVKFFRGAGLDALKLVCAVLLMATGEKKHDPSSMFPPENTAGGLE